MTINNNSLPRVARPGMSMMLLFALFFFFLILVSSVSPMILRVIPRQEAALRILTVIQDLLVFILPPVMTAMLATKLPATLLGIDRKPEGRQWWLAIAMLVVSIPAMNSIVAWNEGWHLPDAFSDLEMRLREMEDSAKMVTDSLIGGGSMMSMIVSVLLVGVLAGVSEELFFRGGIQRLLLAMRVNHHVAIWSTALIFSLLHFQFFGFVPRLLLGAGFGYLLWFTGSLWVPITVHTLNNSLVVVLTWWSVNHPDSDFNPETFGVAFDPALDTIMVIVSVALTAVGFRVMKRWKR